MQVQLTVKSPAVTPFMKEYAKSKVEQRLEKHAERITSLELLLSAEKERKIVEIIAHVPGHQFVIKEEADDMEAAVDRAVERMEQQFVKLKEKLIHAGRKRREPLAGPIPEDEEEEAEESYQEIVDRTDFSESSEE